MQRGCREGGDWWEDFKKIVRELLDKSGVRPQEIAGVGISTVMAGIVPVDKDCSPLRPAILYGIDSRSRKQTADIIAEIGDIRRFESQASVAKYAGLVWTQHQSGDFEAQNTRLIKSGNRYLRYYLLEAANSVRRCDSEFRRYYDLKFHEVNKFQHKRALALTARKLVRVVFRLLKDNRLYIVPES